MFKKLSIGLGGSIIGGGLWLVYGPKKVTTGSYQTPPALTQAQIMSTANKINTRPEGEDYYPLFSSLDGIDFDNFRRKRAFQVGEVPILPEEFGADGKLRGFWDMADILPVQLKNGTDIMQVQNFDWEKATKEQKVDFLDNFESIQVRNLEFNKPLAVIINPNSGRKIDKQSRIEEFFKAHNIPYEIHATKKAGDSFTIPLNLELQKYSGLISCGGDGTLCEVVNGMLEREDGYKVPVGIIPNGSGNAAGCAVGIRDTQMSLEAINARTVFKHDLYRILWDTENNEEIPKGGAAFKKQRVYSMVGFTYGRMNILKDAIPLKPYFGEKSYDIAAMKSMLKGDFQFTHYDVTIDGKPINTPGHKDCRSLIVNSLMANKILNKPLNFPACSNDGLMEIMFISDHKEGLCMARGKREKEMVCENYTGNNVWFRGKKCIVEPKDLSPDQKQVIVDGETCDPCKKFTCTEIMPGEIEFMFDPESFFKQYRTFE